MADAQWTRFENEAEAARDASRLGQGSLLLKTTDSKVFSIRLHLLAGSALLQSFNEVAQENKTIVANRNTGPLTIDFDVPFESGEFADFLKIAQSHSQGTFRAVATNFPALMRAFKIASYFDLSRLQQDIGQKTSALIETTQPLAVRWMLGVKITGHGLKPMEVSQIHQEGLLDDFTDHKPHLVRDIFPFASPEQERELEGRLRGKGKKPVYDSSSPSTSSTNSQHAFACKCVSCLRLLSDEE
ncbi:unnamed protein product, partial [Mesorhabditis spiculigera]